MTVKELIKHLKNCNPNAVCIVAYENDREIYHKIEGEPIEGKYTNDEKFICEYTETDWEDISGTNVVCVN